MLRIPRCEGFRRAFVSLQVRSNDGPSFTHCISKAGSARGGESLFVAEVCRVKVSWSRRSRGEMDITTVFGTVVPGSNPGGSTSALHLCDSQDSNGKGSENGSSPQRKDWENRGFPRRGSCAGRENRTPAD